MFGGSGFFEDDTDPDGIQGFFSGASNPGGRGPHMNAQGVLVGPDDPSYFNQPGIDGFGPGDYSGGYTGEGDRVYWGPDGPIRLPPPAVQAVNTQPPKGYKMQGGILVKVGVKGAQAIVGGTGGDDSSTGDTVLLPSDQSSVIVPGADLPGTTGRSWGPLQTRTQERAGPK